MTLFSGMLAVFSFELRRSITWARIGFWLLLAAFPPLLVGLMRYNNPAMNDTSVWCWVLYGLVPEFTCLAGLWYWMSPSIHSELENRTWVYMAVRPGGRRSVLLGKYLTALVWTISAGWAALFVAMPIAYVSRTGDVPDEFWRGSLVLAVLVVISCVGRGAAFALIAVVAPQRAMVFSFTYALIFEFVIGAIPAVINQLTVSLRLRSLMVHWMNWQAELDPGFSILFDTAPPLQHVLAAFFFSAVALIAAVITLEQRQFPSADEG